MGPFVTERRRGEVRGEEERREERRVWPSKQRRECIVSIESFYRKSVTIKLVGFR